MWQTTGCLITADGSDDELIRPEGILNYKVPPPLLIEPDVSVSVTINPKTTEEPPTNEIEIVDESSPLDDGTILEDKKIDRDYEDELVGKPVKGHYENGWFYGCIDYFNKVLEEYKVTYGDNTTDFICKVDIDGIDLILC